MDIILIFLPVIIDLIRECFSEDQEEMKRRLRNPGSRALVRMARAVARERGLTSRQYFNQRHALKAEVLERCLNLTDEECKLIHDEYLDDRGPLYRETTTDAHEGFSVPNRRSFPN